MREFFRRAIYSHNELRSKLRTAITGGEIQDESKIIADNRCELGAWIYGEGLKYRNLKEYESLKHMHAQFHQISYNMIRLIKEDKKEKAIQEINNGEQYQASYEIVQAIMNIQKILKG